MNVMDAETETREDFEGLFEAMEERLLEDEAYVDLLERPLRDIVEQLCKDLTLEPDWSLWEGEGWIEGAMPVRARHSPFINPSRRRILGPDGEPIVTPAALAPLTNGHVLE
jgi:hypothetical protein